MHNYFVGAAFGSPHTIINFIQSKAEGFFRLFYCITEIGEYAFYNCTLLQIINLPNSLNSMANSVFSECVSLQEIRFPNNISEIPSNACSYCTSLKTVYIDNGPNEIEADAFIISAPTLQTKRTLRNGTSFILYNGYVVLYS